MKKPAGTPQQPQTHFEQIPIKVVKKIAEVAPKALRAVPARSPRGKGR